MPQKKCVICGRRFKARGNRQKYCHDISCHREAARLRMERFRERNPEYFGAEVSAN